jgi:uncharacterized damage-inducible protein DinB
MDISVELQETLEHLEWADAESLGAVLALPAASHDERIRSLLIHIHEVQWAYLHLWRGDPVVIPERGTFTDLGSVSRWARDYHSQRRQFVSGIASADLDGYIVFPWAERLSARFGKVCPATLRQSIVQIGLHSAYHRGQVATRLRELGAEPPLVDFVAWVWRGQPAAAWPEIPA